jgi:hypothetical protein
MVKVEAKAEVKNVRSSLNLNLELDLGQSRAAILRGPDLREVVTPTRCMVLIAFRVCTSYMIGTLAISS